MIVRQPLRSYLRVKRWDGREWTSRNIPLCVPGFYARLLDAADEARLGVEAGLRRVAS